MNLYAVLGVVAAVATDLGSMVFALAVCGGE